MKTTLSTSEIASRLISDPDANWSYAGATALAEYLEDLEASTGEELEFDRCALRCDFSEYESLVEWAKDYFTDWKEAFDLEGNNYDEVEDIEMIEDAIRYYIQDNGTLIEFDGGIIVSSF